MTNFGQDNQIDVQVQDSQNDDLIDQLSYISSGSIPCLDLVKLKLTVNLTLAFSGLERYNDRRAQKCQTVR